ncbi:hypothetical protein [Hyphococcus sp.]|uniref:hypothetical protein n=1 Tax=Hyphococcus sp. TaxID=2038636 RepID=UPI003CCBC33D
MAIAVSGAGSRYDVRPNAENRGAFGPLSGVAGASKDVCQGACAGFLSLIGATHLTGAESVMGTSGSSIDFLDNIWSSLAANGMAGPVELLGGVALFLAARRTVSRTLGLIIFIAIAAAIANGYTLADMLGMVSSFLQSAAGVVDSIPVTQAQSI